MQVERTISISKALRYGWEAMKRDFRLFVSVGLVGAAIALVGAQLGTPSVDRPEIGRWIASTLVQLAQVLMAFVWIRLAVARHDGSRPAPSDVLPDLSRFLAFLLATVVYGLLVAVGLALLILPGVLLAARLGLYGFAMAAEPLDPIAALRRSFEITRGSTVELVLFGFALLGINVLGTLALGVGLLATVPTTAMAAAFVYRRFAPRHAGAEAELRAAS